MDKSIFSKDYALLLDQLREARRASGVTQESLASRLGTTQSLVSKCERGERRIDVVELRTWCKALGLSFTDFLAAFEKSLKRGGSR
jgi:transcriptional regulator with XRE-family HTH domain